MNDRRRGMLRGAIEHLKAAEHLVSTAQDQEADCLDNMPENLSDSERAEKMEEVVDLLCDAGELVSDAIEKIEDAIR